VPDEVVITPDDRRFRDVMGHFATGVTIVTAMEGGEPIGLAVNSFTSVSLDPPLVLFCAANTSTTWPRIQRGRRFAVNVIGEGQEELSRLFALKGADRFAQIRWHAGVSGSPVFDDAIAYVDCETDAEYPGGDHTIVLARVLDFGMTEGARPLIFFRGAYSRMHPGE
jgi:3-hydroxy-9,10-secoandrosta-1,3,5(10)-triene-9,17-dione monooxygenase reductase component